MEQTAPIIWLTFAPDLANRLQGTETKGRFWKVVPLAGLRHSSNINGLTWLTCHRPAMTYQWVRVRRGEPKEMRVEYRARLNLLGARDRVVSRFDLEGGQFVQIVASSAVDTEEALEWTEMMIGLKRTEIAKKKAKASAPRLDPAP